MSKRGKYSIEEKIRAAEQYINGKASAAEIAAGMRMSKSGDHQIREWAAIYRESGAEGFHLGNGMNGIRQRKKNKQ